MTEKSKKEKKPKAPKIQKSEEQITREYAERVMRGKQSRGHVDKRFDFTKTDTAVNKDMWLDSDFFFSVVFQSGEQKYQFLKKFQEFFKFEIENFEDSQIQIVNGLKLADAMKIELKREKSREFPYGSLDLKPYVLDDESTN